MGLLASPKSKRYAESKKHRRATRSPVLGLLARQVKDHESVFVVLTPGPGFRDVAGVVEADDEPMLMSCRGGFEISRALKFKGELFDIVRVRSCAHAGLVVRGAIMDQGDGILVDAIERDHLIHTGSGKRFHYGSV